MSDRLGQLTSRSLDVEPLAVRPKALSRFEVAEAAPLDSLETHAEVERNVAPSAAEAPRPRTIQPQQDAPEHERTVHANESPARESLAPRSEPLKAAPKRDDDIRPPAPIELKSDQSHWDSIARQLEALDGRLRSLPEQKAPVNTTPVAPDSPQDLAGDDITVEENHFHNERRVHHHRSETVEDRQTVFHERVIEAIEPHAAVERLMESPGRSPTQIAPPRIELDAVSSNNGPEARVDAAFDASERSVAPPTPAMAQPSEGQQRLAKPVPEITIERVVETDSQTQVTVTIGRIEVRGPSKTETAAAPRIESPKAKVMDLNEYMRIRAGGRA